MVERRTLLSAGCAAGVGALLGANPAPAAAAQSDDSQSGIRAARAIDELRESLERQAQIAPALLRVRDQQHVFLKANHKFPDFVEVGIGIWEDVYDWHFTNQQPLTVERVADGRYVMTVMFTTLVLRPDQGERFIGYGLDVQRPAGRSGQRVASQRISMERHGQGPQGCCQVARERRRLRRPV